MQSLFFWNFKAAFHGHGLEFQDFREYTPLDDAKYIDWALSSRENTTIMRRYREDKQGRILCVVDNSPTLALEWGIKKKLAKDIISLLWTAALKSWETFWWFVYWADGWIYVPDKKLQSNIYALENLIDTAPNEYQPTLWKLLWKNQKRSVIFYMTDRADIDIWALKTLGLKHDVIIVFLSTHFENTLQWNSFSNMRWGNTSLFIDLWDEKLKQKYMLARANKLKNLKNTARKYGMSFVSLDETSSLYLEFLQLMKQRLWRR